MPNWRTVSGTAKESRSPLQHVAALHSIATSHLEVLDAGRSGNTQIEGCLFDLHNRKSYLANFQKDIDPRRSKPSFHVPFDKDEKFVGREDVLDEIDTKLKTQRRIALAGIGGIG